MPKEARISILGAIGTFTLVENGKPKRINGVQLADVISQVESLPENVNKLTVEVGGLGGNADTAKLIRGFLKSIQPRIDVTTKQVSDMASATTIVFTAGKQRLARLGVDPATGKKYRVMVHNTWMPHTSGNADELQGEVNNLRLSDDEFIDIYQEDTGISREAIAPLMKAESWFDADQALALKFATGTYQGLNQAAYMAKTKEKSRTGIDRLLAALGLDQNGDVVNAAPPAELMGQPVTINGAAAVDGVYTVVGGVITALEAVQEEQAEPAAAGKPAPAPAAPAPVAAKKPLTQADIPGIVKATVAALKPKKADAPDPDDDQDDDDQDDADGSDSSLSKRDQAIINAVVGKLGAQTDDKIKALKGSIKSEHRPIGRTVKKENKLALAKEWDRSWQAGEHVAMKQEDPERWNELFFAKYGKEPDAPAGA